MIPIIIDANAYCHKAKHTLGDLTNETMHVGVIFGFLGSILKLAKKYETNQFIFAWDSQSSLRLKRYAGYKEKRRTKKNEKTEEEKEVDDAAYAQFDKLFEDVLPKIGFKNNFKFAGYEGDDVIASIVDNNLDYPFYIASGDEDMYQCISGDVAIINNTGVLDYKKFKKEYGIEPEQWSEVKAIAGCISDDVPGIPGVGDKTAIKYLKGDLKVTSSTYQKIRSQEGRAIYSRNLHLVTLPFAGTPIVTYTPDKSLSLDGFCDVCNCHNFQYYLKKDILTQWKTHLNLR